MGKKLGIIVVVVLSMFTIMPFFQNGFFPVHDDTQVVRVYEMGKALKDGMFPVRWVKDLGYGYGYPIFNFYAPLSYYVGGFINMFGVNALDSTKAMMGIGIILSGVFMYFLAREFWGELGGIISGLFYVYAPYHAVDIYVRGDVGEFWAYAFLPLMALGLYRKRVIIGAIGFAGVILSHNLTAMMVLPFLITFIIFILFREKKLYAIRYTLYAILLGLGISAFYWLPALLEMTYTNVLSQVGGGADFRDHFVCWQQLWQSTWGFGGSAPGCIADGLSLKIGKLYVLVSIIAFIGGVIFWKKDKLQSTVVLLASGLLLLAIFFMLEVSRPVWEAVAPMEFVQYPWRFLIFASFFSSFLAGSIIWWLFHYYITRSYYSIWAAVVFIFFLLFFNIKLFQPQTITARTAQDYTNEHNVKWVTSRISDEYMPKDFIKPNSQSDVVRQRINGFRVIQDKTQEFSFVVDSEKEQKVLANIAPFPAWKAFIDGNYVNYTPKNNGINILIPKGKHEIKFSFMSTTIEKLANAVSIISILTIISGILWFKAGLRTRFHV